MVKQIILVKQAKKGDHEAFIKLIQGYENILYNTAYRFLGNEEDVADALQETILIAFQKIKQLDSPKYFNTWICKILINHCQKTLKSRQFYSELDSINVPIHENEMENLYFKDSVSALDEKYSTPLTLYYYHGFSIKEISLLLDEPVGTTKSKLARGKQQLKEKQLVKGEIYL